MLDFQQLHGIEKLYTKKASEDCEQALCYITVQISNKMKEKKFFNFRKKNIYYINEKISMFS